MNWRLGLNFYSSILHIFNPADLNHPAVQAEIKSEKYHIYMVCKRKKIMFESSVEENGICYTTLFYLNEKLDKEYLRYQHPANKLKINEVKDGYFHIDTDLHKDVPVRDFAMINNFAFLHDDPIGTSVPHPLPSDLEVVYIGQAFGRTVTRKIDYRISNHDKIQKIVLEIIGKATSEEVLIIGIKVGTNDMGTAFSSLDSPAERLTVESLIELKGKASKRITEGQEITFYEASLIKYFQPKLNTEYKQTFPSPDFTSYDEIYETDFEYCAMTVDTWPVGARIFSEHVPERKYVHYQHYPLTTNSEKKSLFEYLMEFEGR